ncbi:MAG: multicopper oxidase domain-containing protein [Bacteroidota bacterium]
MFRKSGLTFLAIFTSFLLVNGQPYQSPLWIPPTSTGTSFTLDCDTGSLQLLPGFRTLTYGINGDYLGPTLIFQKNDSVSITINNHLNEETSMHWHGLHVPAAMDGGPETTIPAGGNFVSSFKVMNPAATYWYHPHVHMSTEAQVTKGMAGIIIVRDSAESALDLPRDYGTDDIPVILQDRTYSGSNQFIIGGLSDSMLVNGVIRPYLDLQGKVNRLRILNASSSRVYNLGFSDNRNFHVIASDASLLPAPYTTNRLQLTNGERAEILLDLNSSVGDTLYLMSYSSEMPTTIPGNMPGMMGSNGPLEGADFQILQIRVLPPIPGGTSTIPTALVPVNTWDSLSANRTRTRTITGQGMAAMGNFYLDGFQYIMGFVNDTMRLGDIELWNVTNFSNISHPMHVHDVSFRVLSRNGSAPPPTESGWKDVFNILPQETVSIIMRFEDYTNAVVPYMYHCHNLAHEDMGMMTSFIVVDTATSTVTELNESDKPGIFPNPSSGKWNIHMERTFSDKFTVEIQEPDGRLIRKVSTEIKSGLITIDTDGLANGCYILRITGDNEKIALERACVSGR